jgi:hypothetical protein
VASTIGGVTQAATGTGQVAGDVLGAAQGLRDKSEQLRAVIGEFLGGVKAA